MNRLAGWVVRAGLIGAGSLGTLAIGCSEASVEDASTESDLIESTSAYTDLDKSICAPDAADPEGNQDDWVCAGQGDKRILVSEMNGRQRIYMVDPGRDLPLEVEIRKLSLDNGAPATHFGPKAEWRGKGLAIGKVDPYALIVRYFVTDAAGKERNHLVVTRLDGTRSCIVGTVDGATPSHNEKAREIADANKATKCPAPCGEVDPGQVLSANESIVSCGDDFELVMQSDGNLVLYDRYKNVATWDSRTNGKGGASAVMQEDGNFVVYDRAGKPLWHSGTQNNSGAHLVLSPDGVLSVLAAGERGAPLWTAKR